MTTRSVSPLETDADLLWVLGVYQLDNPRGTIRAAIEAGHTEQTLRARIGYLRSQLVQVPFTERGACTVEDAPSWKFPFYAGKVRACLVNPDKVQGDPALGWGSVDAVWASYDKEASQLAFPHEGATSPKRWVPEDAYRGKRDYAPMGGSHDERPKTKRMPGSGQSAVGSGEAVSAVKPTAHCPLPTAPDPTGDRLDELLSTKEGRAELWQLVAKHCMGAARLKPQFDSGNLLNSGLMAARTALKMEGGT